MSDTYMTMNAPPQNRWLAIAVFLLPFTAIIKVRVVGDLFLYDLVSPIVLMSVLLTSKSWKFDLKPLLPLLFFCLVWLAGAVITDVYRETPAADYLRGWGIIVMFTIHLATLWLLTRRRIDLLAIYFIGMGIFMMIEPFMPDNELGRYDPWKFGMGIGASLVIGGFSVFPTVRRLLGGHFLTLALVALSLISLWLNSRSLFGVLVLAVASSVVVSYIQKRPHLRAKVNPFTAAAALLLGLGVSQAAIEIYSATASSGMLGESARAKYLMQASGDVSLLQGGRPESSVSLQAIADSPILGHGSWAKDAYYVRLYSDRLKYLGLPTFNIERLMYTGDEYLLIPSHSHIFGAWVNAGVLGALVWIYAIILAFLALYALVRSDRMPPELVTLCAFFVLWDTLFSPFGADQRIFKAAEIIVLLFTIVSAREKLAAPARQPVRRSVPAV